jgi:hypothetical protein
MKHTLIILLVTISFAALVFGLYLLDLPYHFLQLINPPASISLEEVVLNQDQTASSAPLVAELQNRTNAEDPFLQLGEAEYDLLYADRERASYLSLFLKKVAIFQYEHGFLPQFSSVTAEQSALPVSAEFGTTKLITLGQSWQVAGLPADKPCGVLEVLSVNSREGCAGVGELDTELITKIIGPETTPAKLLVHVEKSPKKIVACFMPSSSFFKEEAARICSVTTSDDPEALPHSVPVVDAELCRCLSDKTTSCYYCAQ